MEMRAVEAIGISEDITPPLPPLAFSLFDSFLPSHCSACSLPLPLNPHFTPTPPSNLPHHPPHLLNYCSPHCSSLDFSSSASDHHLLLPPHHPSSSHLRLARRLLSKLNDAVPLDRIAGLITNYEKFMDEDSDNYDNGVLGMVKEGARALVAASGRGDCSGAAVEEAVMCLVLTNAVEVQDEKGRNIGIAVYDWRFSWINHSCSPNACYVFLAMNPLQELERESRRLRIHPAAMDGGAGNASDCKRGEGYGPRIVVRSIKAIQKDEEVTIAYTDLLQPKELRQSELCVKYLFNCCCNRCSATPTTYVDRALLVRIL